LYIVTLILIEMNDDYDVHLQCLYVRMAWPTYDFKQLHNLHSLHFTIILMTQDLLTVHYFVTITNSNTTELFVKYSKHTNSQCLTSI
jgi:hypothetical protein